MFAPADAATRADPWFVRVGDYPGVGSQLAARAPVVLAPGAALTRGLRTLIADGVLDDAGRGPLGRGRESRICSGGSRSVTLARNFLNQDGGVATRPVVDAQVPDQNRKQKRPPPREPMQGGSERAGLGDDVAVGRGRRRRAPATAAGSRC